MLRLLPEPVAEVDVESLADFAEAAATPRRPVGDRPWVSVNTISSIDGAVAVGGSSRPLGNAADKTLLLALRRHADILLVGRRTAEVEQYRRPTAPTAPPGAGESGARPGPRVALVSGSLQVSLGGPLFEPSVDEADPLPVVVTTAGATTAGGGPAPFEEVASLANPAPVLLRAGRGGRVDVAAALRRLRELGAATVLCEGGPTLNAHLLAADVVDEINLTVSPAAVFGSAPRMALDPGDLRGGLNPFRLDHLAVDGDFLFVRYLR
ncbi:MAG TPA: hypothetical protein DEP66_03350, partial [Acidimicrobiaceae bacterium]|nr:hypothetical protein [Acidimicrobiaceae bacterium]